MLSNQTYNNPKSDEKLLDIEEKNRIIEIYDNNTELIKTIQFSDNKQEKNKFEQK